MKLWDDVIAVLQYPIQSAGMSDDACPVGSLDQLLDQFVDDRTLDAEDIAAALLVGRRRAEKLALLVARRQRLRELRRRHVEIEGLHALFVLCDIDGAHPRGDPHPLE